MLSPNVPAAVLWLLRATALAGLAVMLAGPAGLRAYGTCALLASAGAGALMLTRSDWRGAGPLGIRCGKLVVTMIGLGLLGGAYLAVFSDCRLPGAASSCVAAPR